MAPIDRFEAPGGRGFAPGGGLPDASDWQARPRELGARLAEALRREQADAPVETARVLHEAVRLPDAARQGALAALVGGSVADAASVLRERVDQAFPEGSEGRQKLGETLARLSGEDTRGWSRSALEAKLVSVFGALRPRVASATARASDTIERSRGSGPFGSSLPVASAVAAETAVRARGLEERPLAGGLQALGPVFAARSAGQIAGSLSTLAGKALSAREALLTHGERDAVVRYGVDLADEHVGSLFESLGAAQRALGHPASAVALRRTVSTLRESVARSRGEATAAAFELQQVASRASGGKLRAALTDLREIGRGSQRLEGELRMTGGKAAVLAGLEQGTAAPSGGGSAGGGDALDWSLTGEDLARLGSRLDPTKPPPQTLWSESLVNRVCELGRQRGGVSDAEGHEHYLLAGRLLEAAGGAAVPLGAADLAGALKAAAVALETVDPGQLEAAARYVSGATSGAEQQERLRKALDSFTVLERTGVPPLGRQEMVEQLWAIARVPGHALQKLSDAALQAKFQEVVAAVNSGPGRVETKVGDHKLSFTVGANGTVTGSECKKPGFFSKVGGFLKKVAPIALTVMSFIPATAPFARIAQGAISLVRSIRSKSLLGVATAAAGMVAGGASAIAGRGAEAASSAAARVAAMANNVARGLQGVSSLKQGSVLGGLASIGASVAGGIGRGAEGTATGLQRFANQLGEVSTGLSHAARGLSIVDGYRAAGRAVDQAKLALREAQASGDPARVAAARSQLAQAEKAKTGALLGGAASAAGLAADIRSSYTHLPGDARAEPPPPSRTDQVLRGVSRGLGVAEGLHGGDLASAGVNALGFAAAVGSKPATADAAAGQSQGPRLGLTDAVNMADAALSYHQTSRAADAADRAVADAERALTAARLSGDAVAVAQAEANLQAVRRSREGALLGAIGAGDSLMQTAAAVGQKLDTIRTAHKVRQEADRAERVWQGATEKERALVARYLDERSTPAEREAALAGIEALRQAKEAYNAALDGAMSDPKKLRAMTDAFEQLQGAIEAEVARMASAPVPARVVPASATGHAALRTPLSAAESRPAARYGVATVARGTTVWEISQRSGVPVERILEFNAEQGQVIDPAKLQVGQQILVPLGEGDMKFTPRTSEEVEAMKRAAFEARRASAMQAPTLHSAEIPLPGPGRDVRGAALDGLVNDRAFIRQDEADSRFAFLSPATWVDTKADDAKNAARDVLRQAIDRLERVARDSTATDAQIYAAMQEKNRALQAFNSARGVVLGDAAQASFLTPVKELAQDAQDVIHGATGRVTAAIERSGAPAPLVAAATLPLHVVDSVADLNAGFVKGAADLVDGVAGLIAHPVETTKGVVSLIDRAAQTTLAGRAVEFLAEAAFGKYDSLDAAAAAWKERSDPLNLVQAKWDFTRDMGQAMLSESIDAWKDGHYSEAVGIFLGQSADVLLAGGVLGKGSKAARLGQAADVLDTAADAQRVAGVVERTGRALDTAGEVARTVDTTTDAARVTAPERKAAETAAGTGRAGAPASTTVEGTRSAGAAEKIPPKTIEETYADLINSDRPWSWAADFPNGEKLTVGQRRGIRADAIRQGLIRDVPYKPGTRFPDFGSAGMIRRVDSLPRDLWLLSDDAQFRWLDARIPGGRPPGTTWHHSEIPGRMELVPFGPHNITNHVGGRSPGMWAYPRPRSGG